MTEPWTPGPWTAERDVLEGDWGYRVTYADPDYPGERTSVDRPADARLIAAAPEMAELLERLAEPPGDYPFAGEARRLLARIRGEA